MKKVDASVSTVKYQEDNFLMNKIGINWKYKWLLLRDANEILEAKVKD